MKIHTRLSKVDFAKSLTISLVILLAFAAWAEFLDRESNLRRITSENFSLSCSTYEKYGRSELIIQIEGYERLYSSIRVKNCKNIASRNYNNLKVIARKNQDIAWGLSLDGKVIVEFEQSMLKKILGGWYFSFCAFFALICFFKAKRNRENNGNK